MIRLTRGAPALNVAGLGATGEDIARVGAQLLLDRRMGKQFEIYITRMAQGDFGGSFFTRQAVSDLIAQRIGISLQLAGAALLVVMLVSVPLGIVMGAFTRERRHPRAVVAFTRITSVHGQLPYILDPTLHPFAFACTLST